MDKHEFRKEIQEVLKGSGYWDMVVNEEDREAMINNACERMEEVRKCNDGN